MWIMGVFMMWKSTSSSDWEYLVMLKGLGFESYVCQILCYFLIVYFLFNVIDHEEW